MPRPCRNEPRAHRLEDAQEQAAQRRPRYAADAAQHGGGEGLDARDKAHEEVRLAKEQGVQDSGCPGHGRADGKGDGDHPIDVDAHQGGDVLVLGDGPHGLARLGAVHKEVEADAA